MKPLILLMFFVSVAFATVMLPMDQDQVIDASNMVIYGEVMDYESSWVANEHILTYNTVKVIDPIYDPKCKNSNSCSHYVCIEVPGGKASGIAMRISGAPRFSIGDKRVFLLKKNKKAAHRCVRLGEEISEVYNVVGFSQGMCRVTKNAASENILKCNFAEKQKARDTVSKTAVHAAHIKGTSLPYNSFKESVQKRKQD